MRTLLVIAVAGWAAWPGAAQQAGPALSIDAAAGKQAISPDIYGINFYWNVDDSNSNPIPALVAAALGVRPTVRRWGGNSTSTYHWQFDVSNIDADWFYEVLPGKVPDVSKLPAGSSFNAFADQARTTGGKILGTVPILGWLPKARQEMCSFNQAKYPNQCKIDPYYMYHTMTCGDGIQYVPQCGTPSSQTVGSEPSSPVYIQNDPTDAYAQYDQTFQAAWVQYLITRYGKGNQGGVAIWSLDNEPIWWDSTHRDIHPNPYTYDENLSLNIAYAAAIKQADPTALVSGPVADNWASLYFSKKDITAGWSSRAGQYWSNPVDRNAHGGVPFLSWYLSQMQQYEQQHGTRLLDILDVHAYYEPSALDSGTESAAIDALRLDSTREFWDPSYIPPSNYWIVDPDHNGAPVAPQLIPRLRQIVAQNYPGTKIAISEYNWSGFGTLNGALAQAELLGVFGREGLDMATLWGPPGPTDPVAFAFRMYRNYDGMGGAFGETGVQSTSTDLGSLSVFGALRSDLYLTAVVINKTSSDLSSTLALANFVPGPAAQVWRYSGASLGAIVQQPDVATSAGARHRVPGQFHHPAGHPAGHVSGAQTGGEGGDQRGLLRHRHRTRTDGGYLGQRNGAGRRLRPHARRERHGKHHRGRRAHSVRRRSSAAGVRFGHAVRGGGALFRGCQSDHPRAGGIPGSAQRSPAGRAQRHRARPVHQRRQRRRTGVHTEPGQQRQLGGQSRQPGLGYHPVGHRRRPHRPARRGWAAGGGCSAQTAGRGVG